MLDGAQACLLERLLGGIEVAELSQQGADRAWPGRLEGGPDPGGVGRAHSPAQAENMTGRTSSAPLSPAATRGTASRRATSWASSRLAQSTR